MECEKIPPVEISRLHNLLDAVLLGDDEDGKRAVVFVLTNATKAEKPVKTPA
jgi:hypothetical protein